ncbi:MAG: hypothetical protein Q8916_05780 [Bacteroidota bacterium]|nr:hypothetical protein [Bacteroidota bacterium]MDP4237438.1 hypothetical protein [Bacteroidota bacterium]
MKIWNTRERTTDSYRDVLLVGILFFMTSFISVKVFAQDSFSITNYFTEKYRDFPMMKVSIVPPDGFIKDTNEPGFINRKMSAAIRAQEIRQGIKTVAANFFKSFDSTKHKDSLGMKLLDSYEFRINKFEAHVAKISGEVEGDDYLQWLVFVGDSTDTYLVKGFIPEGRKDKLEQQVRSSLLSVFYEPDRRLIPIGADPTTTSSVPCSCSTKKKE